MQSRTGQRPRRAAPVEKVSLREAWRKFHLQRRKISVRIPGRAAVSNTGYLLKFEFQICNEYFLAYVPNILSSHLSTQISKVLLDMVEYMIYEHIVVTNQKP